MQEYHAAFDRYLTNAAADEDVEAALRDFERSAECPVLTDFVMYTFDERLQVARNRHRCAAVTATSTTPCLVDRAA